MILFGVLMGVGGGGLGSFYPKNVETALDTHQHQNRNEEHQHPARHREH